MTSRHCWLLTLGALLLAAAPACAGPDGNGDGGEAKPEGPSGKLTLLYTNDMHAAFLPRKTKKPSPSGSGILAIDAAVRKVRAETPHTILIDAGDVLSGHPVSTMEHEGVQGGALFDMLRMVDYDVLGLGNHDFDNGLDTLGKLIARSGRKVACGNVTRTDGGVLFPAVAPYHIFKRGDLRVGVIGLVLPKLKATTGRSNTEGLEVEAPLAAAKRLVAEVDPKTDVIVVILHEGVDEGIALGKAVPGIDVVVTGHDHQWTRAPRKAGEALVVQAGSEMRTLGRLNLEIAGDKVVRSHNDLLRLPADGQGAGEELTTFVGGLRERLGKELGIVLADLEQPWTRNYYGESSLGDWVADAIRAHAKAEVGLINSGGLRKNLAAGKVTTGDMMEIVPFRNYVCSFSVTGAQLRKICRHNAWSAVKEDHGILQISGVSYTYKKVEGEQVVELLSVKVGGEDVVDDRVYTCATNDFILFDQPEKYMGLVPEKREHGFALVQDVLIEAVRKQKRIASGTEGRITQAP